MPDILLTTLNAKHTHAAFGLRYLLANLGPLQSKASILEFDIQQRAVDVVEAILAQSPKIVGLGVYIWNVTLATEVCLLLKRLRPEISLILGGPEVSYEHEQQAIVATADYVICGEADLAFAELCSELIAGRRPGAKIIHPPLPDPARIQLPYSLYTDHDVAHRILYVEASRGCPFSCEFCLSSLDIPVRQFPLEPFLQALEALIQRGARQFKFVDRTFNLNLAVSRAILDFFLERMSQGLFLHFEMIPDRLPASLREAISRFPPGSLQLEIGVQTFDPATCERISRKQDNQRLEENFRFLRQQTSAHLHADLIAGLPGESLESFGRGFDRLLALAPQEIQVGILKRLRGTPIVRHDNEWAMLYNPQAPYEILSTRNIDFAPMQIIRRFARHWDLVVNNGQFPNSAALIWADQPSAFEAFMQFSQWLHQRARRSHGIALTSLMEFLFEYLSSVRGLNPRSVAAALLADYQVPGRTDTPPCLRPHLDHIAVETVSGERVGRRIRGRSGVKRQQRHLGIMQGNYSVARPPQPDT